MEMLLTVTTDVFEVPTFYLRSCALLMIFNFCTDSENKMGNKMSPPQKEDHHYHPHPQKIQNNKVTFWYVFKQKKLFFF